MRSLTPLKGFIFNLIILAAPFLGLLVGEMAGLLAELCVSCIGFNRLLMPQTKDILRGLHAPSC